MTTSTDLARFSGNAVGVLDATNDALARLGQWVEAASNAQRLVAPLINTAFVPDAYRPKVDPRATPEQRADAERVAIANGTAAVLQGLTLGVDPLVALQQIYIVHGRPGMYAKFMVALVQSHGHEVWTEDLTDTRAVVCGRRRGTDHIERVVITMDMARRAKWTSNAKYQETPQDMLWSRAAGRVCDRIASDVLKGIASVEQIQDEIVATAEVGPAARTVTPRRRPAPAAIEGTVEEPTLDEDTPDTPAAEPATDPEPTGDTATPAQTRKLHALLRDKGMTNRAYALKWMSDTLDRPDDDQIDSTKTLTRGEASTIIDALDQLPAPATEEPSLLDDGDGAA